MSYIRRFIEEQEQTTLLYILVGFLAGLAVGLLISPVKNGIAVGSYNGSYNEFENSNSVNHKGKKHKCCKKHN